MGWVQRPFDTHWQRTFVPSREPKNPMVVFSSPSKSLLFLLFLWYFFMCNPNCTEESDPQMLRYLFFTISKKTINMQPIRILRHTRFPLPRKIRIRTSIIQQSHHPNFEHHQKTPKNVQPPLLNHSFFFPGVFKIRGTGLVFANHHLRSHQRGLCQVGFPSQTLQVGPGRAAATA